MDAKKPGASPPGESETILAQFVSQYPRAQYHCAEFLVGHLCDCSRVFGGDLQEMLILAVIGQMHLRSCTDEAPDGTVWRSATEVDTSISASRLSDVTGIPRQTVRRKLQKLESLSWIAQNSAGRWHILIDGEGIPKSRADLAALNDRSMERFARLHASLKRIA
ncbi:hypothetical protein [uncultured Alsobacter sp.]|uniref:hypothetical protein n=1 Tax=uncultured Alsobacter sp. TaxID=1748258 RepID=UPI0025DB3558|nr:hypothetical protein [uncultured Alsobacter sp.]